MGETYKEKADTSGLAISSSQPSGATRKLFHRRSASVKKMGKNRSCLRTSLNVAICTSSSSSPDSSSERFPKRFSPSNRHSRGCRPGSSYSRAYVSKIIEPDEAKEVRVVKKTKRAMTAKCISSSKRTGCTSTKMEFSSINAASKSEESWDKLVLLHRLESLNKKEPSFDSISKRSLSRSAKRQAILEKIDAWLGNGGRVISLKRKEKELKHKGNVEEKRHRVRVEKKSSASRVSKSSKKTGSGVKEGNKRDSRKHSTITSKGTDAIKSHERIDRKSRLERMESETNKEFKDAKRAKNNQVKQSSHEREHRQGGEGQSKNRRKKSSSSSQECEIKKKSSKKGVNRKKTTVKSTPEKSEKSRGKEDKGIKPAESKSSTDKPPLDKRIKEETKKACEKEKNWTKKERKKGAKKMSKEVENCEGCHEEKRTKQSKASSTEQVEVDGRAAKKSKKATNETRGDDVFSTVSDLSTPIESDSESAEYSNKSGMRTRDEFDSLKFCRRIINRSAGFALDIVGTVCRGGGATIRSGVGEAGAVDDYERLPQPMELSDTMSKIVYRSKLDCSKSVALPNGRKRSSNRVRLACLRASHDIDYVISFIRKHVIFDSSKTVFITGVSASLFKEILETQLNIRTEILAEFKCLVQAMTFLLKNLPTLGLFQTVSFDGIEHAHTMMQQGSQSSRADITNKYTEGDEVGHYFPALFVNCGTDIAMMKVEEDGSCKMVDYSLLAKRFIAGLSNLLTGVKNFTDLIELAENSTGEAEELRKSNLKCILTDRQKGEGEEGQRVHSWLHVLCANLSKFIHHMAVVHSLHQVFFAGPFVGPRITRKWVTAEMVLCNASVEVQSHRVRFEFIRFGRYLGSVGAFIHKCQQSDNFADGKNLVASCERVRSKHTSLNKQDENLTKIDKSMKNRRSAIEGDKCSSFGSYSDTDESQHQAAKETKGEKRRRIKQKKRTRKGCKETESPNKNIIKLEEKEKRVEEKKQMEGAIVMSKSRKHESDQQNEVGHESQHWSSSRKNTHTSEHDLKMRYQSKKTYDSNKDLNHCGNIWKTKSNSRSNILQPSKSSHPQTRHRSNSEHQQNLSHSRNPSQSRHQESYDTAFGNSKQHHSGSHHHNKFVTSKHDGERQQQDSGSAHHSRGGKQSNHHREGRQRTRRSTHDKVHASGSERIFRKSSTSQNNDESSKGPNVHHAKVNDHQHKDEVGNLSSQHFDTEQKCNSPDDDRTPRCNKAIKQLQQRDQEHESSRDDSREGGSKLYDKSNLHSENLDDVGGEEAKNINNRRSSTRSSYSRYNRSGRRVSRGGGSPEDAGKDANVSQSRSRSRSWSGMRLQTESRSQSKNGHESGGRSDSEQRNGGKDGGQTGRCSRSQSQSPRESRNQNGRTRRSRRGVSGEREHTRGRARADSETGEYGSHLESPDSGRSKSSAGSRYGSRKNSEDEVDKYEKQKDGTEEMCGMDANLSRSRSSSRSPSHSRSQSRERENVTTKGYHSNVPEDKEGVEGRKGEKDGSSSTSRNSSRNGKGSRSRSNSNGGCVGSPELCDKPGRQNMSGGGHAGHGTPDQVPSEYEHESLSDSSE